MMNTKLSKSEFYAQTATQKRRPEWILFWVTIAVSIICIPIGGYVVMAAILACAVCGFGIKKTLDKRLGLVMLVLGVISCLLLLPAGVFGPGMVMALSGWLFYKILGNLDKAYNQYLETGEVPDLKGL